MFFKHEGSNWGAEQCSECSPDKQATVTQPQTHLLPGFWAGMEEAKKRGTLWAQGADWADLGASLAASRKGRGLNPTALRLERPASPSLSSRKREPFLAQITGPRAQPACPPISIPWRSTAAFLIKLSSARFPLLCSFLDILPGHTFTALQTRENVGDVYENNCPYLMSETTNGQGVSRGRERKGEDWCNSNGNCMPAFRQ